MRRIDSINFAMRHPGVVFSVFIMMVAFGVWSLPRMNKDEFPQFTIRQGVVAAVYPGATAEEIEDQVTKPLERFLFSYPEIDKENTYSITNDGIVYTFAGLRLEVKSPDETWAKIRAGLQLFQTTSLPRGVVQIAVIDDFGKTSSVLLAIESTHHSPREIERYANTLCDNLRTIPEMGKISILGQEDEEIAIILDHKRLTSYGINQSLLLLNLALEGFRTIGGKVANDEGQTLLQVSIPYNTEYDIGQQIVYTNPIDGKVVKLRDIATITRRYRNADQYISYYQDSLLAQSLIVNMEMYPNNNIVEFGKKVDAVMAETAQQLPPDVYFHRITDQPKVVNDSVTGFLRDLILSMLVVILVMLMLFPMRTALIAATGVPICAAISIGMMYLAKIELNTVTLAALITVLGMVVDNTVIVLDGYTVLHDQGYSRRYSASVSTRQLIGSMVLATASIAGMFFPVTGIITGPLGEFVQSFPWAILFALIISTAYAVWGIPFLATQFIRNRSTGHTNAIERIQNAFFGWLEKIYERVLKFCFHYGWATLLGAVLVVVLGGWLFTKLNIQMMPMAERECFAVEIHLAEGSSVDQTAIVADSLARILNRDERVVSVTSFVGQSSPRFHASYAPQMAAPNYAQFIVNTISAEATEEVLDEYAPKYSDWFPNAYCRFKQMDYNAVKNPVEVYIKGDDRNVLAMYRDSVKARMRRIPDLTWIHSDYDETAPTAKIVLHTDEATRLGITQTTLSVFLASAYSGQGITSVWEDDYEVPVVLYLTGDQQHSFEDVRDLLVPTAIPNTLVPLRQIADVTPEWHKTNLGTRNGIRTITVSADMNRGVSSAKAEAELANYVKHLNTHPLTDEKVKLSMGGNSAGNVDLIPQLILSIIAALVVMLVLLFIHYRKVSISVLALSMSALCIFGACLGLKIFNLDFSITAVLGVVAVLGIIVRNAILMYDYAEELMHKGMSSRDAAFQAGIRRMRPIFLTSATTALGVIPMIIAATGLWMPLGVTICFGTVFTLPLVVTVMPIAYWKAMNRNLSKKKKKHNAK